MKKKIFFTSGKKLVRFFFKCGFYFCQLYTRQKIIMNFPFVQNEMIFFLEQKKKDYSI